MNAIQSKKPVVMCSKLIEYETIPEYVKCCPTASGQIAVFRNGEFSELMSIADFEIKYQKCR